MKMWHISNAGVILKMGNTKIGIDIFTEEHIAPYKYQNPYQILDKAGKESLDNLNILAYTHKHPDHFSKIKTQKFLTLHPDILLWETKNSSINGVETLLYEDLFLQKISSIHMGKAANCISHNSYLISYKNTNLLITGDARPDDKFYSKIKEQVDLLHILITPFPSLGLKSARKTLNKYFSPQRIFLLHFPAPEYDLGNWLKNTKKVCQTSQDCLADPIFCTQLGKQYFLS